MVMTEPTYLSNQFLIAMPTLADPNFFQTVTYISEHNANGALGLVINRPLDLSLGQLLEHLQIATERFDLATRPVYLGGPVQPEQGFVLHSPVGRWGATLRVTEQIGITTSRDILQAVARGEGPGQILVTLGYAGWGPGVIRSRADRRPTGRARGAPRRPRAIFRPAANGRRPGGGTRGAARTRR